MKALHKYCCIAIFVMLASNIYAQHKTDTIKLLDTLIEAPPVIKTTEDTEVYFEKITITPKVHLRNVPDSIVEAMKKDPDFWYANAAPLKKKETVNKEKQPIGLSFYRQPWFKTMLWIIIIATFVAVVIWYLAVSNVRLFRKAATSITKAVNEDEQIDIFSISYDLEISKAINTKNYRLTIRLLYLQTLKMMAEKGIINYKAEITNSEYVWQLQGTTYYNDFARLTRDFDYTWYGKFEVSEAAFLAIHNEFTNFKSRI
jgi:Domain of unknown function (DUF4129)